MLLNQRQYKDLWLEEANRAHFRKRLEYSMLLAALPDDDGQWPDTKVKGKFKNSDVKL